MLPPPAHLDIVLRTLWHEFALSTRNLVIVKEGRNRVARTDFGKGPRADDLAHVFHQSATAFGEPTEALIHLSTTAGWDEDVNTWLNTHLERQGWDLPSLWAAYRIHDPRHRHCPLCSEGVRGD